jgi:hypothetical protein
MKIGSHNSMTYLPVKKWWMKPFKFIGQCQSKNIQEQYNYGARLFDLRIVFDKQGNPGFAHGSMDFDGDVFNILDLLNNFDHQVYCRLINERDKNYDKFKQFCMQVELKYNHIMFYGGRNKKNWEVLYQLNYTDPEAVDKYSSWNNDVEGKGGTGYIWDDLFPRIYAILNNKKNREKYKNKDIYLLQDFLGKY